MGEDWHHGSAAMGDANFSDASGITYTGLANELGTTRFQCKYSYNRRVKNT